jgi:hypothetical protein
MAFFPTRDVFLERGLQFTHVANLDDEACAICFRPYSDGISGTVEDNVPDYPTQLPCGHVMGYACIQQWTTQSNTCPFCRAELFQKAQSESPAYREDEEYFELVVDWERGLHGNVADLHEQEHEEFSYRHILDTLTHERRHEFYIYRRVTESCTPAPEENYQQPLPSSDCQAKCGQCSAVPLPGELLPYSPDVVCSEWDSDPDETNDGPHIDPCMEDLAQAHVAWMTEFGSNNLLACTMPIDVS